MPSTRRHLALALLVATPTARAADLHVAPWGDNAAAGNAAAPLRTIGACASRLMPGDTCWVHEGVYRETVRPARSGTVGAPVRFEAVGGPVTVTGLDVLDGWQLGADGVAMTAWADPVTQLFVDGELASIARWPDLGHSPLQPDLAAVDSSVPAATGSTTLVYDDALEAGWEGARIWMNGGSEWVAFSAVVTTSAAGSLGFSWPRGTEPAYAPRPANPYFLYGSLQAMDAPGEWLAPGDGTVRLVPDFTDDPAAHLIEGRTRRWGFDLTGRSYVEVVGFRLEAASIDISGTHDLVEDCTILWPTPMFDARGWATDGGLNVRGEHHVIRRTEIAHGWADGVTLVAAGAAFNVVEDCVLHDLNWAAVGAAGVRADGTTGPTSSHDNTVRNSTIYDLGRSGVVHRWQSDGTVIAHNDIHRFGWLARDLGGTYTYGGTTPRTEIHHNLVHDSRARAYGDGVYLDSYTEGVSVHHNAVWATSVGLRVNQPSASTTLANNTVWGSGRDMQTFVGAPGLADVEVFNQLGSSGDLVATTSAGQGVATRSDFVDADGGDLRLAPGSPHVDAGVVAPPWTDGAVGPPDRGAFEVGAPWTAGASWVARPSARTPFLSSGPVFAGSVDPVQAPSMPGETGDAYNTDPGDDVQVPGLMIGNPGSGPGSDTRAFLAFDLPSSLPGRLVEARLGLYLLDRDAYGRVDVRHVFDGDASTPTYDLGSSARSTHVLGAEPTPDRWLEVDVTDAARNDLAGGLPHLSFALRGSEGFTGTGYTFAGDGQLAPSLFLRFEREDCTDGLDDDVDGLADCDDPDCADALACLDADGDGWHAIARGGQDCDDLDASVFPAATEACNPVDDDCDPTTDDVAACGTPQWWSIDGAAGGPLTLTATGVASGSSVGFVAGVGGGTTRVSGCATPLDVGRAVLIGFATADATGTATLTSTVPPRLAGRTYAVAAMDPDSCARTPVVLHTL